MDIEVDHNIIQCIHRYCMNNGIIPILEYLWHIILSLSLLQ